MVMTTMMMKRSKYFLFLRQEIPFSSSSIPTYDEIINGKEEDDDEEFEKAEEFERKFNFRYQEPDAEFVSRFDPPSPSSLIFFFF